MADKNTEQRNPQRRNQRSETYIPDPLEAGMLKELGEHWRYFKSKDEYNQVLSKYENKTVTADNQEINVLLAARANAVIRLGAQMSEYSIENIENAEQAIRSNKKLWRKLQAISLYNNAGFKPEITDIEQYSDEKEIRQLIKEKISSLEHGTFENGTYIPSKAEKNILRTLRNYGIYMRNPQSEDAMDRYYKNIGNNFSKIMKRKDYGKAEHPKSQRKENKMSNEVENEFNLDEEQLKICQELGIDPADITNIDEFNRAVKEHSAENTPTAETHTTEAPTAETPTTEAPTTEAPTAEAPTAEAPTAGNSTDENTNEAHSGEQEALRITAEDENTPENQDLDTIWIKHKAEYYEALAAKNVISNYEQDKKAKGFSAKFNNAQINYTDKNNVSVTADAGYKVFDVMLKEPDNKGRPIEFTEKMSKEMATKIYAACVLNGNPMQGAVPKELDEKTLAECGLSAEDIKKVKENLNKSNQPEEIRERTTTVRTIQSALDNCARLGMAPKYLDVPTKNNEVKRYKPSEGITPLDEKGRNDFINNLSPDELKSVVSMAKPQNDEQKKLLNDMAQKVIGNNIEEIKTIRHDFDEMKEKGLISITKDEQGKSQIVAGANGNEEAVKKAQGLILSAENLHKESLKLNSDRKDFVDNNYQIRQEQLGMKKSQMTEEESANRQKVLDLRDKITAKRLGLISEKVLDRNGKEVTTKQGEDLKKYQSQLSAETLSRVTGKFGENGR